MARGRESRRRRGFAMKAHDCKFQEEPRQVKKKKKKKKKKNNKMRTMCVNRVWYDRDNSTVNCDAQRLQRLVNFAELAIDFFNKTSPVKYNFVELVYATAKLVSGYLFHLTFTAKRDDDDGDAKTFDAWIYEAMKKPPRVKSVEIVAT